MTCPCIHEVYFEPLSPEIALRNVSMFFRSNPNWSVVDPLRNIGEFPDVPNVVPDRSLDPVKFTSTACSRMAVQEAVLPHSQQDRPQTAETPTVLGKVL